MANADDLIAQLQRSIAGPADAATSALARLEQGIRQEQAALDALSAKFSDGANRVQEFQDRLASAKGRLDDLKSGKEPFDARAYKQASDEVSRFGEKLETAQASQAKLQSAMSGKEAGIGKLKEAGPALEAQAKALDPVAAKANDAARGMESLKGSLDGALQGLVPTSGALGEVSKALQAMGPEGEAAAVALGIVVTVVTGLAQTLWDWTTAAIAAAQKRDALIATFNALGGGAGAGERTLAVTLKLAASLPFVTSQVNQWAKSLAQAGAQGPALEQGVKAIAAAAAITQTGGEAAEGLIKKWSIMAETGAKVKLERRQLAALGESGADLEELARLLGTTKDKLSGMTLDAKKLGDAFQQALINKGGPALENLGLTWDSIKAKFNEGLGSIFAGLSDVVKPLMTEIKGLFGEFNRGSAAITVARAAMTSFLSVVISLVTRGLAALHLAFLYVEVAALTVAVAVKPITDKLRELMRNAAFLTGLKYALIGLSIPLIIIAAAITIAAAAFMIFAAIVGGVFGAMIYGVIYVFGSLIDSISKVKDTVSKIDLSSAGSAIIDSLVGGITSKISAVGSAMAAVGNTIINALPSVLQMHSPSVILTAQAEMAAGSVIGPLEDAEPAARKAMGALGGGSPDFGGAGGKGGSRGDVNFNNCTFGDGTSESMVTRAVRIAVAEEADMDSAPA